MVGDGPTMAELPCPRCAGSGRVTDAGVVGLQLANRRVAAGLTQRRLARRMGVSPGTVGDIESGRRNRRGGWTERYVAAISAKEDDDECSPEV